jgi:hypothetical protein
MTCLYLLDRKELYDFILRSYGIAPFTSPFVDISSSLAAWECVRQGVDVVLANACDVLDRPYNYSPLWLAAAGIPLGIGDTPIIGWGLGLFFISSLSLLPPPKRPLELLVVLAATLSTMVVFALERANLDLLLFVFALGAGVLPPGRPASRLLSYIIILLAALLKYYPITALIIVCRERISALLSVYLIIVGLLGIFWWCYQDDILRGLPSIATGRYDTDLFAAKNLPFMLGMMAEYAAQTSRFAAIVGSATKAGLYAALVGACFIVCRKLVPAPQWRAAFASLPSRDRLLLVIGSAVIAGCFFAGQSIGYRGVYLLLVIPGLLAMSRDTVREMRVLCFGNAAMIVLLMWGECLRLALYSAFEQLGIPEYSATEVPFLFWLTRELCWWWVVAMMLAVIAEFLRDTAVFRSAISLFSCRPPMPVR